MESRWNTADTLVSSCRFLIYGSAGFTTIRDHPRSLCCWPQLPVKFHVILTHRSEDIAIWNFRIFGLKCLFRPPNCGFGGLWAPKCEYSSSRPPKDTSLRKSASFKLSAVKIRWRVWPVGELTESVTDTQTDIQTHTGKFIVCPCIANLSWWCFYATWLVEYNRVYVILLITTAQWSTMFNVPCCFW